MPFSNPPQKNNFQPNRIFQFFYNSILVCFGSSIWLLIIPKEAGNAVFLGYSLRRLALLLLILLPAVLALACIQLLNHNTAWQDYFEKQGNREKLARLLLLGGLLTSLATWSFAFLFHFMRFSPDLGLYARLLPFLVCYFLLGLISLKTAAILLGKPSRGSAKNLAKLNLPAFWIAAIILITVLILIEVTGLGKDPQRVSISSLGVPLLEGQVWYVTGLLVLLFLFSGLWGQLPEALRLKSRINPEPAVIFGLWLLAVVLWMSLPLPKHNYFAPQVLPPNFEKYPFSDADQYDRNGLMVMLGAIQGTVISKPLYVSFLAILHAIGGYSYGQVVLLQTLALALFPGILYLIGKELHSRMAGIGIALLAILREVNAIQASSIANVSNSKLLLSDMPATLMVSLLLLVLLRWVRQPKDKLTYYPFAAGGILGMLILMRIQTILMLPFLLLLAFVFYFKRWKKMLIVFGLILLSIALVISPILIRNHAITGVYWVDDPASSSALYRFFIDAAEYDLDIPQADTREEMLNRNLTIISQVLGQNLGGVLRSISDHFFRNVISTMLVLPVRLGNSPNALDLVNIEDPFWAEVYTKANLPNLGILLVNILLIAAGIAAVFHRHPNGILALAGFYIFYNLSSALVRLSGWRFILPVDWFAYGFFAIGLILVLRQLLGWLAPQRFNLPKNGFLDPSEFLASQHFRMRSIVISGMLFLLSGALIPLREALLPPLVPEYTRSDVCKKIESAILDSEWSSRAQGLFDFCMQDDTRALMGFGFYPRFFKTGEGYYQRSYDPNYGNQDYSRLTFRIIGTANSSAYIKTDDPQIRFPNGSIVYLVGSSVRKSDVQVVLIDGDEPELIISSTLETHITT